MEPATLVQQEPPQINLSKVHPQPNNMDVVTEEIINPRIHLPVDGEVEIAILHR